MALHWMPVRSKNPMMAAHLAQPRCADWTNLLNGVVCVSDVQKRRSHLTWMSKLAGLAVASSSKRQAPHRRGEPSAHLAVWTTLFKMFILSGWSPE